MRKTVILTFLISVACLSTVAFALDEKTWIPLDKVETASQENLRKLPIEFRNAFSAKFPQGKIVKLCQGHFASKADPAFALAVTKGLSANDVVKHLVLQKAKAEIEVIEIDSAAMPDQEGHLFTGDLKCVNPRNARSEAKAMSFDVEKIGPPKTLDSMCYQIDNTGNGECVALDTKTKKFSAWASLRQVD